VQCQNQNDKEIIFVDDSSTDRTRSIIASIIATNKNVRTIFKRKNSGPAKSRDLGRKFARGKYILFVDSDDFLVGTDGLKIAISTAERHECEVLRFNGKASSRKKTGRPLVNKIQVTNGNIEKNPELFVLKCLFLFLWRKSFLDDLGDISSEIRIGEDAIMLSKALSSSNLISSINLDLYRYTSDNTSMIRSKWNLRDFYQELKSYDISSTNISSYVGLTSYIQVRRYSYFLDLVKKAREDLPPNIFEVYLNRLLEELDLISNKEYQWKRRIKFLNSIFYIYLKNRSLMPALNSRLAIYFFQFTIYLLSGRIR
jgi:glycosyltransferase involved in cell wall biosynthesis